MDVLTEALHLTADGHLLTTSSDGKLVATSGDGKLVVQVHALSAAVTAAAISEDGTLLATGQENDADFGVWVLALSPHDGHRPSGIPQLVAHFTLPVRHLAWCRGLLGIATDDGKLLVWDRSAERPHRQEYPMGGSSGVRSVAFDPRGELLAAALTSGALCIFGLEDASERCRAYVWPRVAVGSPRIQMAWHPDGSALALPGEPALRLLERGNLAAVATALQEGHREPTSIAAWSAGGEFLASASEDAVALWRPPQLALVVQQKMPPHSLLWGSATQLTICAADGAWVQLAAPAPGTDGENFTVAEAAGRTAADADVAGFAKAAEDEVPEVPNQVPAEAAMDGTKADDVATNELPAGPVPATLAAAVEAPVTQAQMRFQPGATTRNLRYRYLAWNEHGTLKLQLTAPVPVGRSGAATYGRHGRNRRPGVTELAAAEAAPSRVVVDYSRERCSTAVRGIHAPSTLALGALGPGVFALAVDGCDQQPPHVAVHMAKPWGRPCFQHELPAGEAVEALAVSRHFVASQTRPGRFLRVNTLTGMPICILSQPGEAVCLAAFEDLLLSVTQAPGPKLAEPCLEYALYGVAARERLAKGALPLSRAATLRWVGFGAEALPLALDSAGVLRALALGGGKPLLAPAAGEWLPVAKLPEGGACLWPVRAEDGALYCAEVAKPSDEPRVGPTQKLQAVRYCLPFEGEGRPERFLRQALFSGHMSFAASAGLLPALAHQAANRTPKQRKEQGAEGQALFERLASSNEPERAMDVAEHYFHELQELEEAEAHAIGIGQEELSRRISALREKGWANEVTPEKPRGIGRKRPYDEE